ncbi:MAG: hypothetical protein AABW49_00690 [Nanoarchaeota archaeon]
MLTPIILACLLSIAHIFSEKISSAIEEYHEKILSFNSGLFIAFLFLFLIPGAIKESLNLKNVFYYMLTGLVAFHLAEKYLYQHIRHKKELMKELAWLHIIGFFIDYFVIGLVLSLTFITEKELTFLIFLPFLLHTVSSSFSLEHITERFNNKLLKMLLSIATIIGAIAGLFLQLTKAILPLIYPVSVGILIYITMRDMIPKGKDKNPLLFLIGVMITVSVFIITN